MRSNRQRRALTLMELIVVLIILIALAGLLVPLVSSTSMNAQDTTTRATMNALRDAAIAYYQDMKGIPAWTDGSVAPPGATGIPLTLKDLQVQPLAPGGQTTVKSYDPVTRSGWRGPYVLQSTGKFLPQGSPASPGTSLDSSFYPPAPAGYPSSLLNLYGNVGDPAFLDGWGNPVVLQWPSAGQGDPSNTANDVIVRSRWVRLLAAGPPVSVNGYNVSALQTATTIPPPVSGQRGNNYLLFILSQDPTP